MKIAIILGPYSVSVRPMDFWFNNVWDAPRGLTGSDLTFVQIALELKQLGHEIYLFTVHAQPHHKQDQWEGIPIFNYEERLTKTDDTFDCFISINEPDVFRDMSSKPLKILWQMLNDFPYCQAGWEDMIDIGLGVCQKHVGHLKSQISQPEKWKIVPLGCKPEWYTDQRVPGRVVWLSSADRGLHWLLSQWPQIKHAVPHANLKIFYHFNYDNIENIEPNATNHSSKIVEIGQRVRYIKNAMEKLKSLDVEHVGSIGRTQMQKELSEAEVFAFSCDTVVFSEGFSVSTMEAHASFTVPIITDVDCLGEVYQNSGAIMIKEPVRDHLPEFTNAIIKSLTDKAFANDVINKCRSFASENYTWSQSAQKLINIIQSHSKINK